MMEQSDIMVKRTVNAGMFIEIEWTVPIKLMTPLNNYEMIPLNSYI